MKNKFYHLGVLLAVGTAFTACSNDELLQDMPQMHSSFNDGRIAFVQQTSNLTRATQQAQNAGHYEFGVFAYKGASSAATTSVMDNYLVAYNNGSNTGFGSLYYDLKNEATTWGNNAGGEFTDVANGVSSWFYEGLGKGVADAEYNYGHTAYNTPQNDQILKYWDDKEDNHFFWAYAPYSQTANYDAHNPTQVSLDVSGTGTLKYTNLSAFYTNPAKDFAGTPAYLQTTGANKAYAEVAKDEDDESVYNNEILNYNEALYAYTAVVNNDYHKDVQLDFQHVNAKINIAFYEAIKGYKVKILDVYDGAAGTGTGYPTKASGTQFSPATKEQAETPMAVGHTQPTDLPEYVEKTDLATVTNVSTTPVVSINETTKTSGNIIFRTSDINDKTWNSNAVIGEAKTDLSYSKTTYYALPKQLSSDATGYTLHVTYQIIPQDGSAVTTVYDARVWVAPEYTRWEAGKAYTYIFKITDKSNGVTDPKKVDPAATGTTWVDETDPRVPEDPALTPIVFDGVTVTDYDEDHTGKQNDVDEWVITDPLSWTNTVISGTPYYYYDKATVASAYAKEIAEHYTFAPIPAINKVEYVSDGNFNVTLNGTLSGSITNPRSYKANAYGSKSATLSTYAAGTPASNVYTYTKTDEPTVVVTYVGHAGTALADAELTAAEGRVKAAAALTVPTYKLYFWSSSSSFVPYETKVTQIAVTYTTHTTTTSTYEVTETGATHTYVKTEKDAGAATWTRDGVAIASATAEAAVGSTTPTVNTVKNDVPGAVTATYNTTDAIGAGSDVSSYKGSAYAIVRNSAATVAANYSYASSDHYEYYGTISVSGTTVNYSAGVAALQDNNGDGTKDFVGDLSRFLGALYRTNAVTTKIVYGGTDYTWDTSGTLKGSNWKNGATSLVSALASACSSYFTPSGGSHTVTLTCDDVDITFNATLHP